MDAELVVDDMYDDIEDEDYDGVAHSVSYVPERYVRMYDAPLAGGKYDFSNIYLKATVTEYFSFEPYEEDDPVGFGITLILYDAGYDDEENFCIVVQDTREVEGAHVYYVWRHDQMINSGDFDECQKHAVSTALHAASAGWMASRVEHYRSLYPDKTFSVDYGIMREGPTWVSKCKNLPDPKRDARLAAAKKRQEEWRQVAEAREKENEAKAKEFQKERKVARKRAAPKTTEEF